jgi:hypothetical protein
MGPNLSTIKRLFAVSGNQCAFQGCDVPLSESSGTVTGEIAHIKAANKKGPRYDPAQSEEDRHGYDNLILLCGRHHTIIDAEHKKYSIEYLHDLKKKHEQTGIIEITPYTAVISQTLLNNYQNITINNNRGNVAVNSPGVIQAKTVNIKNTKTKVTIAPPEGSIASNLEMSSYIEYLIKRYQEYQKQDTAKENNYKYMAIFNGISREFGSKWQFVPILRFKELVEYLMHRIDNTKIGRIRKKREQKRYHSFAEHC